MDNTNMNALTPEGKYGKEAPFNDPVVRCDSCKNLIFTDKLKKIGKCPHCGNRKVREVRHLTESEMHVLHGSDIDPDFIAMFAPVEDVETEITGEVQ